MQNNTIDSLIDTIKFGDRQADLVLVLCKEFEFVGHTSAVYMADKLYNISTCCGNNVNVDDPFIMSSKDSHLISGKEYEEIHLFAIKGLFVNGAAWMRPDCFQDKLGNCFKKQGSETIVYFPTAQAITSFVICK